MPEGGETVLCSEQSWQNGGKGANQAVAAARLGAQTTFCAMLGKDAAGRSLKASIEKEGIDTSFIFETEKVPTGLALILLETNGQNRIIVNAGANMALFPEVISKAFEKDFDALLLQLEMPKETVYYACQKAMEKGIKVVLDAGPAQKLELEKIQGIEILSPNRSEAEVLSGVRVDSFESAKKACEVLQKRSRAKHIVLKLDKEGAMLFNKDICKMFAPMPVQPVDTTAAGDAFTAALTKWYVETGDIERAMVFANAAGALATTKMGAQPSLPYLEEVEEMVGKG